jgi:hypothetical protein
VTVIRREPPRSSVHGRLLSTTLIRDLPVLPTTNRYHHCLLDAHVHVRRLLGTGPAADNAGQRVIVDSLDQK